MASILPAQHAVAPRNIYERVLAVVPLVGSGTKADPLRPEYAPPPDLVGVKPNGGGILAYNCQWSDDNKYALCEFVARDRAALAGLLADRRADVRVFEKGKARRADIEDAFRLLKRDFDLERLEVWVP